MQEFKITQTPVWQKLQTLASAISTQRICQMLNIDASRVEKYSLDQTGIYLDYSKNLISDEVMETLLQLADSSPLEDYRTAMFAGARINRSEQRPVLHTALRASPQELSAAGLESLIEPIQLQKQRIKELSDKIRSGQWLGATGKPITDVVNLGIGGSDLGPKMVCEALKEFAHDDIRCHFVSNVDGEVINSTLKNLNPETTLVVISSKTFTTQETLLNASTAAAWFERHLALSNPYASPHFIGVTASPDNAIKLGLPAEQLLEFWDWVGGRYSLWSSIGFAIAVSVGFEHFEALLEGANVMDRHFREAPLKANMPVLLALIGLWNSNFLKAESYAVIPYCERLVNLPFYLQQLDMESNGKSVTQHDKPVECDTGPIIWGLTGTNGQHSFFQLLHQGTHVVPVDFIGLTSDKLSSPEHHRVLMANMLAQSAALMTGRQDDTLPACRQYPGNRPSNMLILEELTPFNLGALIALYEHKVFVQGCLWNINSYDQWGVELGKELASNLLSSELDLSSLDKSTCSLLNRLKI